MKNSIYQKIHRTAMKIMHAIYHPLRGGDSTSNSVGATQRADLSFGVAVKPKPITNQGKLNNLKYGKSNIGKTGCIPIAIYNVLVLKSAEPRNASVQAGAQEGAQAGAQGDAQEVAKAGAQNDYVVVPEFEDIVERVKSLKAPLFGGRMGTDPYMIDAILLDYGVGTKEITNRLELTAEMDEAENGTLFLITQWNDIRRPLKGIHAYVVEKHADDRWACYNLVYREYPTRATNLTEMLGCGRLIVANKIL
ncbi:MAG: hypothetical protein J5928_00320 [Firmicutes bacterium]|nr:hypothetical protein [Bacillota bacterium]